MHVAYKHLEAKLKVGELTLGQWGAVALGALVALGWGLYVSPFGATLTLVSAVYVGGLPAGAVVLAGISEVDLWLLARSAIGFSRRSGRYAPGPGEASGYVVEPDPAVDGAAANGRIDLGALWG